MNTSEYMRLAQVTEGMAAAKARREKEDAEEAARAEAAAKEVAAIVEKTPVKAEAGKALRMEDLSFEQRWALLVAMPRLRLSEITEGLLKGGFKVSDPTVSRFLKRLREDEAVKEGAVLGEAAEKLAAVGKGAALRAGALEALRGQLFEAALGCNNSEKRLQMYEALTTEEQRLRKLALEEEKAGMQRRSLELQAERLRLLDAARRGGGKYFLEALRILGEEGVTAELKVERMRAELDRWKGSAIEVGSEVKRLEAKAGS